MGNPNNNEDVWTQKLYEEMNKRIGDIFYTQYIYSLLFGPKAEKDENITNELFIKYQKYGITKEFIRLRIEKIKWEKIKEILYGVFDDYKYCSDYTYGDIIKAYDNAAQPYGLDGLITLKYLMSGNRKKNSTPDNSESNLINGDKDSNDGKESIEHIEEYMIRHYQDEIIRLREIPIETEEGVKLFDKKYKAILDSSVNELSRIISYKSRDELKNIVDSIIKKIHSRGNISIC